MRQKKKRKVRVIRFILSCIIIVLLGIASYYISLQYYSKVGVNSIGASKETIIEDKE